MFTHLGDSCVMASLQVRTNAHLASWHSLFDCVYVLDPVIVLVFLLYLFHSHQPTPLGFDCCYSVAFQARLILLVIFVKHMLACVCPFHTLPRVLPSLVVNCGCLEESKELFECLFCHHFTLTLASNRQSKLGYLSHWVISIFWCPNAGGV